MAQISRSWVNFTNAIGEDVISMIATGQDIFMIVMIASSFNQASLRFMTQANKPFKPALGFVFYSS